ncbi:MAG: molybdopterin cofactor-binding domain-containing protein [Vicinamibacterales bacterium]
MNRRRFIVRSGALVVSFGAARLAENLALETRVAAQGLNGPGSRQLDGWIAIRADGSITAFTGKCELGHGLYTAQTQLIAEELCVPFSRVTLVQCDTAVTPDQGTTSGAQSHPANFNNSNLALAGATAREALVGMAAERLGVPAGQLAVRDGVISAASDSTKRVSYAELIGGRTFNLTLNPNAKRRSASEWTVLGTPVRRVEIPAMVTGRFEFVHNVRVPGMLHGCVVRPRWTNPLLTAVDGRSIEGMPGVVDVVVRKEFVGVVAEKPWQAIQAAAKLQVGWARGAPLPPHGDFHARLRSQTPTRDTRTVDSGDVDTALAKNGTVVRATYLYPYQMHGSVGTACAVADVQGGKATIWAASQAVWPLRSSAALVLGLQPESIRVVFKQGPGCYGINGADTVAYDAAILSQAVGRPVRVQLSRADEMAWENYGVAYVSEERAVVGQDGTIVAWDYEAWTPTRGGRPGAGTPGNQVTGSLAGFAPAAFQPRSPAPAPTAFANNNNSVPSYVTGTVNGRAGGTGRIASQRVVIHNVQSPFFTGPLRSPDRLQNTFAHESFIDEIAASRRVDPVEYRLKHLSDPRLIAVVNAAAKAANWQSRPSPLGAGALAEAARASTRRTGIANGRGISCVLYEGDNGYCAMVAEVEVNQDTGAVAVKRLVIANDSGPISNPDGLRNQLEGGAIQGISRTLLEEVTWDDRQVTSVDWRTYKPLYLSDEMPVIETVLINRPDMPAAGAGETAVTVVAGAIGNAIFDATGARLRQVPFTPERVRAAMSAR